MNKASIASAALLSACLVLSACRSERTASPSASSSSSKAENANAYTIHSFKKIQLTPYFWSEGANYGDFNHDGKMDVVSGPYWWEGPDFKKRHEYYAATKSFTHKKADGTEERFPVLKARLAKRILIQTTSLPSP